jgi:hypothetical protein
MTFYVNFSKERRVFFFKVKDVIPFAFSKVAKNAQIHFVPQFYILSPGLPSFFLILFLPVIQRIFLALERPFPFVSVCRRCFFTSHWRSVRY